jgi:AcrR family transcriptional regulator
MTNYQFMPADQSQALRDAHSDAESQPAGRKSETRRKLSKAARELFIARGYHDVRPQDIAKRAGVGHGTFYLHFADKLDCFTAFVADARDELDDAVAEFTKDASDLESLIRGILNGVFQYADEKPGVLSAAMSDMEVITADSANRASLVDLWGDQWAKSLNDLAEAGLISSDYHLQTIGHALTGLMHNAIRNGYRRGVPRETLIDNITRFISNALRPANKAQTKTEPGL